MQKAELMSMAMGATSFGLFGAAIWLAEELAHKHLLRLIGMMLLLGALHVVFQQSGVPVEAPH